jgi:hypothetical protein
LHVSVLAIAQKTNTAPPTILQTKPSGTMRSCNIRNKTITKAILQRLAQDEDPNIRREVASKRKLDATLFEQLSRDPDESVRRAIAINAKCPADILERLTLEGSCHDPFDMTH